MASAAIRFLGNLNSAAGLVSFSTLIAMLIRGKYAIKRSFHSYIRVMVYLDCTAFIIAYIGLISADGLSPCGAKAFWLVADMFWAAKDAFKYGYLAFRCTRIMGLKNQAWNWAIHGAFATSLILYWFYMILSYNLSGACTDALIGNVNFNWSVLPLYVSWLIMDLVMAAGMLYSLKKMSDKIGEMTKSLGKKDEYSAVIAQERLRLVVNAIAMVILNIVSVLNVTGTTAIPGNAIVFVFLQHWIVLSSSSVADDKAASQSNVTGSSSGTSSSGTAATAGTVGGPGRTRVKSGK
ncbi:hypothetical protein BCR44DRAFT_1517598 [Catenaria anguillulae PL171]|uniref:G-protein coupled receptors family 1 profile domain-containing protein n=1 Tax=Catenaria anguillulae PL171 TaxID=765915 RepID=A0A1Y2HAL6_9FUNG|nr:hypothetical protein BCR44DRAFT_1517598 [Catenaria anguillulae PL171]